MSQIRITRNRRRVDGPVHCDVVQKAEAEHVPDLARFCCGLCALEASAAEVNAIVANLVSGDALPQHVVLLRDQRDALLGIASVRPEGAVRFDPVPYLNVYGREKRLAGWTLSDGKTSVGEALVRAALELVTPEGEPPPEMQALVIEDNVHSQRPLEAVGFQRAQNDRLQMQIQGPVPPGLNIAQIKLPSMFKITCPSGKVVQEPQGQELWFRPPGLELAPLDPEVYVGPAHAAREAAIAVCH